MSEDKCDIKTEVDGKWLAEQVAGMIYNQCKARFFNVLESQLPYETNTDMQKMRACKAVTTDVIGNISSNVACFITDVLGDWKQEMEFGGELTDEEYAEAMKEHKEIQEVLR